ncbi:hypothetical protein HDV05_001349, partial [Chytridiales sp. JEL 0842]
GGLAKVLWAPNDKVEAVMVDVYFTYLYFVPGEVFRFDLDVRILDGIITGYEFILPRFLQWQPYLKDVLIGQVLLTQGDARSPDAVRFTSLDQMTLRCPDLYFYDPLIIRPRLLNIFKGEGFGINLDVLFANPGPLHVEIGTIGVRLMDRNNQLAVVTLDVNILNNLEGGNAERGNNIPIEAKLTLNPLFIIKDLVELILNKKQFRLEWFADRPGVGAAPWLLKILNATPEYLGKELLPIILAVLRRIELSLGPFTFPIPLPGEFNDAADGYLRAAGDHV